MKRTLIVEADDNATKPCPNCGSKVLVKTGYCMKCKKKVKLESNYVDRKLSIILKNYDFPTIIDTLIDDMLNLDVEFDPRIISNLRKARSYMR